MPGMGNLWPKKEEICGEKLSKLPQNETFHAMHNAIYRYGRKSHCHAPEKPQPLQRLLLPFLSNWANEYFRTAIRNAMETAVVSLSQRASPLSFSYSLSLFHTAVVSVARCGPLGAVRPRH